MTSDVLSAQDYKVAFDRAFLIIILHKRLSIDFLLDAKTTSQRFIHILMKEETKQYSLSSLQASLEGSRILQLIDRLFFMIPASPENNRLLNMLTLSTGLWIAHKEGEIKELELLVNALATFANQTYYPPYLEELYEISLYLIHSSDNTLKVDTNNTNKQHPWRLLCLNHCIMATRSGNSDLARAAYDHLIQYLPEEANAFFKLGMKKINEGYYPYSVHITMKVYYQRYSQEPSFLVEAPIVLN